MTGGLEKTEIPNRAGARRFIPLKHHGTRFGRLVDRQGHPGGKNIAFDIVRGQAS